MQDDDTALLRRYAAGTAGAEAAFAALVHRHLNLVYSAALRQVGGDAHLAQDVAQSVFSDLARKASAVAGHPVLAGWLYSGVHYAAAKAVRAEQRRRRREREAHTMIQDLRGENPGHDEAWNHVRPTLDAALQELKPCDRDALLLRFFENQAFAAIGARLSLSENAARMRVERALERLRARLERRGVCSTAAALGTALATHSVLAAPAGVAASVTSAVLASGAASASGTALALTFMTANKLPLALAGAVLIGGSGTLVWQQRTQAALRDEISRLQAENAGVASLAATHERLARNAAHVDTLRRTAAELPQLRAEVETLRAAARQAPPSPAAPAKRTTGESGPGEPAYNLAQLDQMPKVTSQKPPVFPDEYRRLGFPGSAKISFIVGADGRVQDAEATEANDETFAQMAIEAVNQWTFEPGRKSGHAVATRMTVPIVFNVRHDDPDWF